MYRIMLADDEGIVIESLKFIIEENFKDQFEIETARSGRAVIELADRFRPDIIFMDIQMPGINGIEAMREIRQSNPSVVFIVLSAYDRFTYAKEAISLGVLEYMNKPFNRQGICEVLEKAVRQIDAKREQHRNDLIIKEKMEIVLPVIESGFIYSIMFREYFEEDVSRYRDLLDIEEPYCFFMAVIFGDTQEGSHMTNAVGASIRSIENFHTIREMIKETMNCFVGNAMSNKIPVCVPVAQRTMDYNERVELIDKCRALSRRLDQETGIRFRIGIGGVVPFTEAMNSYQDSLRALLYSTSRVAHVDDLPLSCDYTDNYPIELEKKMFEELRAGHIDECLQASGDFFSWMEQSYGGDLNNIRLKVLEFAMRAETDAHLSGGATYGLSDRAQYLPAVMAAATLDELRSWYMDRISDACNDVLVKRSERSNDIVERSKRYIEENYGRDLSLDDISRIMDLSPYYFSKLFKDKTGENFVEYLTAVRIEHAKELLLNPEMSMKEICSEVGYSDPNYFSRIFKKVEGLPPTEYREKNLA